MKNIYRKWINKKINKDELKNKTILITGGNSGIGLEVAKYCAYLKMNIIITCRSVEKAESAIKEIKNAYSDANISYLLLDTSSFSSVRKFSSSLIKKKIDIDFFYSNAGTFNLPKELTSDGYDRVIQTNYLGPFLLTHLLLPYLKNLPHKVKIIYTTSVTSKRAKINYEDINSLTSTSKYSTYAESKLLNVHLYLYLINKCKDSNIIPLLVHPGVTATPLIFKAYPRWFARIAILFMKIVFHSPEKAALSTIALLDNAITKPCFYGPRGIYNISGFPKVNKINKHMKKDYSLSIKITMNLLKINN